MTREDESEVAGQCDKCHTPYDWTSCLDRVSHDVTGQQFDRGDRNVGSYPMAVWQRFGIDSSGTDNLCEDSGACCVGDEACCLGTYSTRTCLLFHY
jgi:hypothetical protein